MTALDAKNLPANPKAWTLGYLLRMSGHARGDQRGLDKGGATRHRKKLRNDIQETIKLVRWVCHVDEVHYESQTFHR
ncbi:hypothetical protein K488DRAFT_90841 [Vararia minispora EC-137]|uniref:Uncharacterized protein n=1 Tax=Vararia minispora EC-137 TaxID=1314806 RepID=A0ACB8Q6R1_9AGAM|nr:hypothetical protein K488DRAFT_90841 [Vararia minispora EC-137]